MAPTTLSGKACSLTDSFALIVQGILALISLSTLIIKRHHEYPRRPLLIWFYDTSKQAFAAASIHFLNLAVSYSTNETESSLNPCEWYFINILIDTTIGVVTLFLLLSICNTIIHRFKLHSLDSGQYGDPPGDPPKIQIWLKQLVFFVTISVINKGLLLLLFLIPYMFLIAHVILSPLKSNPRAQVVVVMLVFPLVMNTFQFWLVDQLLKAKRLFPAAPDSAAKVEYQEIVRKPCPVRIS